MKEKNVLAIFAYLFLLLNIVQSLPCTKDDYIGSYTECIGGYKHLIYYKKPDSTCTGFDNIPENKFNIPCYLHCSPGEYLPLGAVSEDECTKCEPGTYSLGGGNYINDWDSNTPWEDFHKLDNLNFKTYCIRKYTTIPPPPDECSGWTMTDNSYASSGITGDSMTSTLELSTTFVKDGTLSFSYRVTAEANFDYFSFEMDENILIEKVSIQREFVTFTVNVTSGVHIFKWRYSKDFILSDGEDRVFIKDITIAGNRWTDSSCIECPVGTYSDKEGQSQCQFCPPDTYSNVTGTVTCEACPEKEYAFSGSTKCTPRPICKQTDSYTLYTECTPKEGGGSSRDKLYFWLEPKICDDKHEDAYKLPNNLTDIQCAPCNPGFFRNASGICQSCGTNEYSEEDAVECKKCDPGEVGRRDFIWRNFEELPPPSIPASQKCSGECGSLWRLSTSGSHIDSGIGHGAYVDNSFTLALDVLGEGEVKFTFQFDCPYGCYLNHIDEIVNGDKKSIVRSSVFSVHTYGDEITNITIPVKQGKHEFSWRFVKYDTSLENRDALVKISEIIVTSVGEGQGGASKCTKCLEGTFASPDEPFCIPCEPGTANNQTGATSCPPCEANTFSDLHGAKVCQPCGDGTYSLEGSTECSADCIYLQSETTAYAFTNLAKETMYGPYSDSENNTFYFNVCFKYALDNPCLDLEEYSSSIACMVDNRTRAHSAGRILNFYPLEGDVKGAHIVYKGGAPCPTGRTRSVNITVLCSPDSGIGVPYQSDPFETEGCVNHFEWKSLYGCPVCLPNDYTFYYTNCENGKQTKVYTWKENPRRCHGGVKLPDPEIIDCVSSDLIPCPEGKYLLLDTCEDCLPGSYSLGGTEVFDKWNTIPKNFKTNCQGFLCAKWKPKKDYIEGVANSWLDLTLQFVKDGRFIFEYQGSFGDDVIFNVEVDQEIVFTTQSLSLQRESVSINVTEGIHIIRWHLVAEDITSPSIQNAYVRLFNVKTSGTKLSDNVCLPVPEGTYQKEEGKNYYEICPVNTKSEGGRSECQPCGENQYAPQGSSKCYDRPLCTVHDYSVSYSECINGSAMKSYTPKEPKICVGGFEPEDEEVECQCPRGYYANQEGVCVTCPEKNYYDVVQRKCVLSPPGKAAVRVLSLFEDTFQRNYDVTTGCTGTCLRSWTLGNQGIDSGVQMGYANSYIKFPVNIIGSEGSIFLSYTMDGENEFEIYVDGVLSYKQTNFDKRTSPSISNSERITIPLTIGRHEVVLNYVNLEDTGYVRVTELGFTDSEEGGPELVTCPDGYATTHYGSSHCEICPAGTYSNSSSLQGNTECKKCPHQTYSSKEGSTECISCKKFGFSELGATHCKTTCSYNTTEGHFDLLPLSNLSITVDHISGIRFEMNLCQGLQSPTCLDSNGKPLATHICAVLGTGKTGIDYGENPDVSFTPDGIIMTFTEGDECDDYGTKRKSTVNLICDLGSHLGVPKYLDTSTACDAQFEWRTPAACKACTLEDYELVYGKCESRKRIISYKLVSDDCFSSNYTFPESYVEPCSEISFPIGAIFGIIGAIILLVGIIIFFYIKNRKLTVEYQLLKNAKVEHFDPELDDENAIALEELNDDL